MSVLSWLKSILHKPDRHAWIKQYEIFKDLNSYDLFLVSNILNKRVFKKGEMLYASEYPLEAIFFIESGQIELIRDGGEGNPSLLGEGKIIGLIDMFSDQVRTGSAKALDAVTAYAVSKTDLDQLMTQRPALGIKLMRAICGYLTGVVTELRKQK